MKSKKLIIILSIILVVLIIITAGMAFVYFKTDILVPTEQLFVKYLFQENNLDEMIKLDNLKAQEEFKKNNSYTSEGELLIETEKGNDEEPKTIKIITNSKYDESTKRSSSEAILKNGENDLFKMSYANDDKIYALKNEQVYEHFIGIRNENLEEFLSDMGLIEEGSLQLPDTSSLANVNTTDLLSDEDKQYLKDFYLPILINGISKEKFSKLDNTNITIGDNKSYDVTGYSLSLTQDDIKLMIFNVLTKAKEDTTALAILKNSLSSLGLVEKQTSDRKMVSMIDDLLEQIAGFETDDFAITISVYHSNGQTLRIVLTLNNEVSINIDIIENSDTIKKILITSESVTSEEAGNSNLKMLLSKSISQNSITYTNNLESETEAGIYKIETQTNLGNVVSDVINNSSYINIQKENGESTNISYSKEIKIAEDDIEISELNNTNTVIVNDYPREQLEIFLGNIVNKLGGELEIAVQGLNTNSEISDGIEQTGGSIINIQGLGASILAIANANGLNPIGNLAGTVAITVLGQLDDLFSIYNDNEQTESDNLNNNEEL